MCDCFQLETSNEIREKTDKSLVYVFNKHAVLVNMPNA